MNEVLYVVYLCVLSLSALIAAFRYRITDKGTRFITWFIWLGLVTEITGRYAARKYHNNLPVFNISCMIEWALICGYFNFSISRMRKSHAGIYLALAGITAGVLNFVIRHTLYRLNPNMLFLECTGIVCMSLYAIYKLLELDDDYLRLNRKTQFWIPLILILYQCGALWSWVMYDFYEATDVPATEHLQMLLLLNSMVTYGALTAVYLLYPKMKRIYV